MNMYMQIHYHSVCEMHNRMQTKVEIAIALDLYDTRN